MITAVIFPVRTTEVMMSMMGAFSRVLTPLVGSSSNSGTEPEGWITAAPAVSIVPSGTSYNFV